jgi:hypothetical protein
VGTSGEASTAARTAVSSAAESGSSGWGCEDAAASVAVESRDEEDSEDRKHHCCQEACTPIMVEELI